MRKYIKYLSRLCNKILSFILVISVCLTSIGFNHIMPVFAGELGQEITITGGYTNGDYIEYYDEGTLMGKILVKIGDEILTPVGNKIVLQEYTDIYQVGFYVIEEENYEAKEVYVNDELAGSIPGDNIYYLSITSGDDITIEFKFGLIGGSGDPGAPPFGFYPVVAYFNGVTDPVEVDEYGDILVPDEWESGTVSFKAKVCQIDEVVVPDDGINVCDEGTALLANLNITGINNRNQINNTVSSSDENEYIIVDEGFRDYGKEGFI